MKLCTTFRSGTVAVLSLFAAFILLLGASSASANELCPRGIHALQKSFDVVQGKGGLWGFLEKTGELKDKSVIGLQIDGKIQRSISMLKTQCDEGKTPDMAIYKALEDVIGDARMVFNLNDRTPSSKILEAVTQVNQKADQVLASMGN